MKVSQIVNTYHISRKALLIYEDRGLLTPKRNLSGYRIYDENEITKLKQIIILRKLNFTLEEIENILAGKPWLENKRMEYDQEIGLLKIKKQFLEQVFYSIKCETDLDHMITVLNQQFESKNLEKDIIPFSLHIDGVLILWVACLCLSFYIFNYILFFSSFILGFSLLLISLKDKPSYQKIIPFLLIILGFIQLFIIYFKEGNLVNIFFSSYGVSLIFYGLSLIPSIKQLLLKHQKNISLMMILFGIILFIISHFFNYSVYISSISWILYVFGICLKKYKL